MPTYDYVCDGCKHEFETFESIKADPQTTCPECRETKLRRKIRRGAAILFKGSGFYQTDYRSDSYKKSAAGRQAGGRDAQGRRGLDLPPAKSDSPKPSTNGTTP